ncbi:MAG: hypothetical protein JRK53_18275 [Deltaproteobacteria bacterium]|nr:hypothetical protein [Deltaproteobacteria bacterium]
MAFSAPSPAQETRSITGEKVVDRGTFTTDAGDDYDTDDDDEVVDLGNFTRDAGDDDDANDDGKVFGQGNFARVDDDDDDDDDDGPGACCNAADDDDCTITREADCTGDYWGDGTDCDPNPCGRGACCLLDGRCLVLTEFDCYYSYVFSSSYQGDDTVCAPNPCPQPPSGACCRDADDDDDDDVPCWTANRYNCNENYLGDETNCDPTDPASTGADPSEYCEGTDTNVTLTAACPDGSTVQWFGPTTNPDTSGFDNCEGALATVTPDYEGNQWVVTAPAVDTIYGVRCLNDCPRASNNCAAVTVTVCDIPSVAAGSNSPVCEGDTVSLSSTPSGGTGQFNYSWSGPDGFTSTQANPTISPAGTGDAGIYKVVITDTGCGSCTAGATTSVTVCDTPSVTAGSNSPVCEGDTISLSSTPTGTGPFNFSWTRSGDGWMSSVQHPTISNAGTDDAGTYTVVVTETGCNSCTAGATTSVMVCAPSVTAGSNSPVCEGGAINLTSTPTGPGPYTYSWSGPDGFISTQANPTISPAGTGDAGTYTLVVTETGCNSCTAGATTSVTVLPKPGADAGADKAICKGDETRIGGDPVGSGGTPPYTYTWTPTTGLDDPSSSRPMASPDTSQSYTVTVTVSNSCTARDTMSLVVNELPNCRITVDDAASDGLVEPGSTHTAWIEAPVPVATIKWTVKDSEDNNLIDGPNDEAMVTFTAPLEPTTIFIGVEVEDGNICECSFEPSLVVDGPDPRGGVLKVWRYIPALAGWGLIGLAAILAGAGAWAVRRRKRR